jgi:hypothetical protein
LNHQARKCRLENVMAEFPVANDGDFVKRSKALELHWGAIAIVWIGWGKMGKMRMTITITTDWILVKEKVGGWEREREREDVRLFRK